MFWDSHLLKLLLTYPRQATTSYSAAVGTSTTTAPFVWAPTNERAQTDTRHTNPHNRVVQEAGARAGSAKRQWQEGDIAFLKQVYTYTAEERAQTSESKRYHRLFKGADGHPVIILARGPSHVLITTVSAYGSPHDDMNVVVPWEHRSARLRKNRRNYRGFVGSATPNPRQWGHLRLLPGQSFPKPLTSWVNMASCFIVPLSVMGRFIKAGPTTLQMEPESLDSLRQQMLEAPGSFQEDIQDPRITG